MIEIKKNKDLFYCENKNDINKLQLKNFGELKDEVLILNIYEIFYLFKRNKIKIKNLNEEKIKKNKNFNYLIFLVYLDLRKKGYIVKSGLKYGFDFRIYDKNSNFKEEHSIYLAKVFFENKKINFLDYSALNRICNSTKKKFLICIIDKDYSITYFENRFLRI